MPGIFLHPRLRNTGVPDRRNYDTPMDPSTFAAYRAHLSGVLLVSPHVVPQHVRNMTENFHLTAQTRTGGDYEYFPGWHPTRTMEGMNPYWTDQVSPTGANVTTGDLPFSTRMREQLQAIHSTQQTRYYQSAAKGAKGKSKGTSQMPNIVRNYESMQLPDLLYDQDCAICHSQLKRGEAVYRIGCNHLFHTDCYDRWLDQLEEQRRHESTANTTITCPLCRGPGLPVAAFKYVGQATVEDARRARDSLNSPRQEPYHSVPNSPAASPPRPAENVDMYMINANTEKRTYTPEEESEYYASWSKGIIDDYYAAKAMTAVNDEVIQPGQSSTRPLTPTEIYLGRYTSPEATETFISKDTKTKSKTRNTVMTQR